MRITSYKPVTKAMSETCFSGSDIISDLLWLSTFVQVVSKQCVVPFVADAVLIHRVHDSVDSKHKHHADSVLCLLNWSFPSCVFRRVVSVIVNAAQAVFRTWSSANVFEKIQIRIQPGLANFNSATTPFWIAFVVLVVTSVFHVGVGAIFWSPYIVATFTVYAVTKIWNRDTLSVETSTRLTPTFDQHSSANGFFVSAIASDFL